MSSFGKYAHLCTHFVSERLFFFYPKKRDSKCYFMFRGLAQWARHKVQWIEITDAHIDPTWASVEQSLTTACPCLCGHGVVLFVLCNRAKVLCFYIHMRETVSLIVEEQNVKIYKDFIYFIYVYIYKDCLSYQLTWNISLPISVTSTISPSSQTEARFQEPQRWTTSKVLLWRVSLALDTADMGLCTGTKADVLMCLTQCCCVEPWGGV